MRKFRVWCCNKNEWEKDRVYLTPNGDLLQLSRTGITFSVLKEETHIVEFSTGELDKAGKEIFEGDIADIRYEGGGHKKDMFTPCVCKLGEMDHANYDRSSDPEYYMCFYFDQVRGPNTFPLNGIDNQGVEIIGNIHENKELLEAPK